MRALPAAAHHHFYSSCNRLRLLFIICCVLAFALWIQKSRRGQVPAGKTSLANNSSSSTTSARSVEARKPLKAAGIRIKLAASTVGVDRTWKIFHERLRERDLKQGTDWSNESGPPSPDLFKKLRDARITGNDGMQCKNCYLSSSCFTNKSNPWQPSRCASIRRHSASDLRRTQAEPNLSNCSGGNNFSLLFVGDSRTRLVFGAVLRKFYLDNALIHSPDGLRPIGVLGLTNEEALRASRRRNKTGHGLHSDFWTYQIDSKKGSLTRRKKFLFIWDKLFEVTYGRLLDSVLEMRPRAIVVGAGIWFVWFGGRQFGTYRNALRRMLKILARTSREFKTPVVLLKHFELLREIWKIEQWHLDKLNLILDEEVGRYKNKRFVVWDSMINLVKGWKSVCLNHPIPKEARGDWRCDDPTHPGPLVADHLADMLLNHLKC